VRQINKKKDSVLFGAPFYKKEKKQRKERQNEKEEEKRIEEW